MWIVPVPVERRTSRPAFLLWSFVAVCCMTFLVSLLRGLDEAIYDWAYRPGAPYFGPMLASLVLHGGFAHLFGNMLFLWCFGEAVEDSLGPILFLIILLVTHAFAMLAHTLTHAYDTTPVVGASGAVSGVMGIYAFLFGNRSLTLHLFLGFFRVGKLQVNALGAILVWLGLQLAFALLTRGSGIAYWAHLGGIGVGFILGFLFQGLGFPKKPARA